MIWFKRWRRILIPYGVRRRYVVFRERVQSGLTWHRDVIHRIDPYRPNSGNEFANPALTYSAVNQFPIQLCNLINSANQSNAEFEHTTSKKFGATASRVSEYRNAFSRNGSDKSTRHDYHWVYARILSHLNCENRVCLLEIGVGTNDPKMVSTMTSSGTPGASLRAFRELLPGASIFGADIDRNILFSEERIRTAWVDQRDPSSFAKMTEQLGQSKFDLIIDDGLHSIEANLNTLLFGLRVLNEGGWVVIEDIAARSRHFWEIIGNLLPKWHLKCYLIKCQNAYVFAARRNAIANSI